MHPLAFFNPCLAGMIAGKPAAGLRCKIFHLPVFKPANLVSSMVITLFGRRFCKEGSIFVEKSQSHSLLMFLAGKWF